MRIEALLFIVASCSSWQWRAAGLDHDVQEFNEELAYWEEDPQEEEGQHARLDYEVTIQRYDAMVRREWVPFLQACFVYGSNCVAALTQLLLLPVFDPLAHFRVADQYLPSPFGFGVLVLIYSHLLAWCLTWYSFMQVCLSDTPGGRHSLPLSILPWYSFMQPTLADTPGGRQRDRQDDEETIQRYDVMVRRERVSLLQACLVFGSICTAGLMQLLLLPVFDPFAKLRVVDHNLPTSLWRWRAAGCVLLTLIGLVLGDGLIPALWPLIPCSLVGVPSG